MLRYWVLGIGHWGRDFPITNYPYGFALTLMGDSPAPFGVGGGTPFLRAGSPITNYQPTRQHKYLSEA